jgi:integrase
MLAKKPLTTRAIDALKPPRKLVYDAVVPGLAVRVTDNGAKAFVLVGRFPGSSNPTARSIAKVGAITLEDARDQARAWLKLITSGKDPAHEAAKAAQNTLQAVCEEYQAREGNRLRSAKWRQSALERLVYPDLGAMPIMEVRRGDIVRLHDRVCDENGEIIANRVLSILRRVFNWYTIRNEDFRSPIVRGMTRPEGSRDRVLTDDELRAVWRATDPSLFDRTAEPNLLHPAFAAYIHFLLLTGARRSEAAEMRWAELTDSEWTLPASRNKTGQELVRPLSRVAVALIAAQPRIGEFVFSRDGRALESYYGRGKAALDHASGVKDWRLHDLRRTARSLMSRAGVPADVAEQCLGHVIGGVRGVYDRHKYLDEKRKAYEKLAALIAGIVEPRENVVSIRGGQR